MSPELTMLYVAGEAIGYARMGTYIARDLESRGVTVYDEDGNPTPDAQQVVSGTRNPPPAPTNLVCVASVPTHAKGKFDGQHLAILTMYEAMTLPETFRETLQEFDTIIVPSWHNRDLFSQYHDNVHYMPLGVDPALWHYTPPYDYSREFRFLISGRGERKGADLAYRAFRDVFGDGKQFTPTPVLVMKSMTGTGEYYSPNVRHVTGRLTPEAELDLYRSAHVYVQPSRGEGFGLQPLQAIATGRPTILTAAHGHESYAHLGIGIGWEAAPAAYFIYGHSGDWWEPDYDQLCEAMWDTYQNYAAHADRAEQAATVVRRDWTWKKTTDRFLEIVGDEITKPYSGRGEWQSVTPRLFLTILNRDHTTDIAGRTLRFERGKEYWEVADVKRVLYDAGLLDPACLQPAPREIDGELVDIDLGLAPEQVESLDLYRAEHAYCAMCHQRLGSQPTKSDDIYAGVLA